MKIPHDVNRLFARVLGLLLSISLVIQPSFALVVSNPISRSHADSEASLFASEAFISPLIQAWRQRIFPGSQKRILLTKVEGSLTSEQWDRIEQAARKFGLSEADKMYLAELFRQRLHPDPDKKPLRIGKDESKGENFNLAADLTDAQRREWLGTVPYAELLKDPENAAAARNISVTVNSLDGGIGENVGRLKWLQERVRAQDPNADVSLTRMGAKGTDLGYDIEVNGQSVFVSIAEGRLLQLIELAKVEKFGEIYFQPLVNGQSRGSYETLLNGPYLFDRLDRNKSEAEKLTYRQVFKEVGIKLHVPQEMLMQSDLPALELETGLITLDDQGLRQPAGHGQWGVTFLWDAYRHSPPADSLTHIRYFINGDNVNGQVNDTIAGYMERNNIPILKLTTAATPIDKKGGKDGVRIVHVGDHIEYVPDQMELADAKATKQVDEFYAAGQSGDPSKRQPFNTNAIYLNESLLHGILVDLEAEIGQDMLARVISPALIQKEAKEIRRPGDLDTESGKKYVPWDGAIGVAIHNLNAYFQTSTDPRVRAILQKHGVDRLLRFVDVPRDFFAPVKSTFDIWWQRHSDFYRFNWRKMMLEQIYPGLPPPENDLSSTGKENPNKDDGFWNELQNLVNAFGNASTKDLKSLHIKGKVYLKDAHLIGHVSIVNETGTLIDLRSPEWRASLSPLFTKEGKLLLNDITLKFLSDGETIQVQLTQTDGSPVETPEPLPVPTTNLPPAQELALSRQVLARLEKEEKKPGSGHMPMVAVISDQHGTITKFDALILDAIRMALPERTIPADLVLDHDKPLKEQLLPYGISVPSDLAGRIYFHNLGDFMHRGPEGVKVFRRSKELVTLGNSDGVTGNHDLVELMANLGFHLPWYDGFNFHGYTDDHYAEMGNVQELVGKMHETDPETRKPSWWAEKLAEYTAFHEMRQKNEWIKSDKRIQSLYDQVAPELIDPFAKKAWDLLRGRYSKGGIDVYTGVRAVGQMSRRWWQDLLRDLEETYNDATRRRLNPGSPAAVAWRAAIQHVSKHILPGVSSDLENHLLTGQWWWWVFDAINFFNYESPEWWSKDVIFHPGWGPYVFKEINENRSGELLTAANYMEDPTLREIAQFYRSHFKLYTRDIYQNVYMHAFLPVDGRTGEFHFIYKGTPYRGKGSAQFASAWEGLDRIENDIRNPSNSLADIYPALSLVISWYADSTTHAKAADVADVLNRFNPESLARANGINRLFTGHIPLQEFDRLKNKSPVTGFQNGPFIFVDQGAATSYGGRGGWVEVGPNGLFLHGFEHSGATEIIKSPRTVKRFHEPNTLVEKVLFENAGIPRDVFLPRVIQDVKNRIALLESKLSKLEPIKDVPVQIRMAA